MEDNSRLQRFEELIKPHLSDIEKYIKIKISNYHDAEDVFQETWIAAFTNLDQLKDENAAKIWFLTIAKNKTIDYYRWKKREQLIQTKQCNKENDEPFLNWSRKEQIYEMLHKLTDDEKAIIVMYYLKDYSQAEIASRLGIAVGTVKSRLSRAKDKIRRSIDFDDSRHDT